VEKLKSKNGYAQPEESVNSPETSPEEEKEGYTMGRICGKGLF